MISPTETEVKIRLSDRAEIVEKIQSAGFTIAVSRQFESNTLYDTPNRSLRGKHVILRLRQSGSNFVITWKGAGQPGPYKSRAELETTLGSLDPMHQILVQLGYEPTFRYEKYRTEFTNKDAPGVVTVDETPIGDFLELEGPGEWIDRTARQLGFSRDDYIVDSYGRLYLAECKRRGVEPADMVFSSQ